MTETAKRAEEIFSSGGNCAQASCAAFSQNTRLSEEVSMKIASAFGGGIARSKNVCGGLTGALMAAGLMHGYTNEVTPEDKLAFAEDMASIAEKFKTKFSSFLCQDLLLKNEEDILKGLFTDNREACLRYVLYAVRLIEKYLEKCQGE